MVEEEVTDSSLFAETASGPCKDHGTQSDSGLSFTVSGSGRPPTAIACVSCGWIGHLHQEFVASRGRC